MPRREDHEVHKGHVVALGEGGLYFLHIRSVCHNSKFWVPLIYTSLSNTGGAVCVVAKSIEV